MTPQGLRTELLTNLDRVCATYAKLAALTNTVHELAPPALWLVSEGLFTSAWSHWEAFLQELLVLDLARERGGTVVSIAGAKPSLDVRKKLAAYILNHPDHPNGTVNWNFDNTRKRAREHLPAPARNRFTTPIPRYRELEILRKIRNAIAHRNDGARKSFEGLLGQVPFSLGLPQSQSVSVGEFLVDHRWPIGPEGSVRNDGVFFESMLVLVQNAKALVP